MIVGLYGSCIDMEYLADFQIGPNGWIDIRFLCDHSGSVNRLSVQYQNVTAGYMGGNGGTIQWQLCNDDGTSNHYPNQSSVLWTGVDTNPNRDTIRGKTGKGSMIGTFVLSPTVALTAGTLYHILLINTDPNPKTNYVSCDCEGHPTNSGYPSEPFLSDNTNLALLWSGPSSWQYPASEQAVANLNVVFTDGHVLGTGYSDTCGITGPATEAFTPSSTQIVTALYVGGSGVTFNLAQGGSTIASGSMTTYGYPNWSAYSFASPLTLQSGTAYRSVSMNMRHFQQIFSVPRHRSQATAC